MRIQRSIRAYKQFCWFLKPAEQKEFLELFKSF